MEIPYTVHSREDTGLYNAKVGIWLFLASEVMLFGALFSSYILLRVGAAPGTWPHGLLNIPLGTINTLVLICSSVTVVMAWASLKMNRFDRYALFQTITVVCAGMFIVIKSFEYRDKFTHYEVHLKDGSIVDGHLIERTKDYVLIHLSEAHRLPASARQAQQALAAAGEAEHSAAAHEAEAAPGEHHERKVLFSEMAVRPKSGTPWMENYGPWHSTYLAI